MRRPDEKGLDRNPTSAASSLRSAGQQAALSPFHSSRDSIRERHLRLLRDYPRRRSPSPPARRVLGEARLGQGFRGPTLLLRFARRHRLWQVWPSPSMVNLRAMGRRRKIVAGHCRLVRAPTCWRRHCSASQSRVRQEGGRQENADDEVRWRWCDPLSSARFNIAAVRRSRAGVFSFRGSVSRRRAGSPSSVWRRRAVGAVARAALVQPLRRAGKPAGAICVPEALCEQARPASRRWSGQQMRILVKHAIDIADFLLGWLTFAAGRRQACWSTSSAGHLWLIRTSVSHPRGPATGAVLPAPAPSALCSPHDFSSGAEEDKGTRPSRTGRRSVGLARRHSGAERSEEPGIHNHRDKGWNTDRATLRALEAMDSGPGAARRPGMTPAAE